MLPNILGVTVAVVTLTGHASAAGALASSAARSQVAAQNAARGQIRFAGMDANGDGRITRSEWRGSQRSFDVHDWNRDGVLSGDEVRPGARPQSRAFNTIDFDSPDREFEFDDWTVRGFMNLDRNRDGRITSNEWHFDREGFRRADHNGDGAISRSEFLNERREDDDRGDQFRDLDANHDGRLSHAEWHGSDATFGRLDRDHDGFLTRGEVVGTEPPQDLFASVDVNHDGSVARNEWIWSSASFDRRDTNRDGRLTRDEFLGASAQPSRSEAYRAGYARGLVEGREAGEGDRRLRNTWDLEGQTELERADSGYDPRLGPREEYQAGYRDAFRRAYREGFGR